MSDDRKAVFLSYAREDAPAARRIAEALRAAGVEVWFDEDELRGGDAWDAKIRHQIRACALFVPVISTQTDARPKGYFRREWKLAVECIQDFADDVAYLLPVVIDDVAENAARVPEKFREVQWTRLPGGETPRSFCERVRCLLAGSATSPVSPVAGQNPQPPAAVAAGQRARHPFPRPLLAVLIAAGLLLLAGGGVVIQRFKKERTGSQEKVVAEARELVAKATALFEADERPTRESLTLAEKFCQQAIALAPNDAEVWATYSRVGSGLIYLTYDRSPERRTQAGDAAARARRLAPDSFEARYAEADFFRLDDTSYRQAEAILRQLGEERPTDKRVWRTLGRTLRAATVFSASSRGREEEAIAALRRAADLPGGDSVALAVMSTTYAWLGRFAEAEKAIDESIALNARGYGYGVKMNVMLRYVGDLARAREALAHVPVEHLREDRDVYLAAEIYLCARAPEKVIELLRAVPRDYLEAAFEGPKSALAAQAHLLAGRVQAAEIEWRTALQVVERRLTAHPNNVRLLIWKARLNAFLGHTTEAKGIFQAAEQLGFSARDAYWAAAIPLQLGDREKATALLRDALRDRQVITPAFLRIDPTWDALRGYRGFDAIVTEPTERTSPAPGATKSVAVLAFRNLSAEKDNDIFSDGISEELTHVLGRVPSLRVAGSTSAFSFKGKNATHQEIGQKLGVTHIVEGTVRKSPSHVRITASLIDATTGFVLKTFDPLERELKDVWAVQDDIVALIAKNLSLTLGATARRKQVDPEAHRLLLEAMRFWSSRRPDDFVRAEARLLSALKIDPTFAEAHAKLALCRGSLAAFRAHEGTDLEPFIAAARSDARKALELDPELMDGRAALAWVDFLEGQLDAADAGFRKILQAKPDDAHTLALHAYVLSELGRLDLALAAAERAVRSDPLQPHYLHHYALLLFFARRYQEAETMITRSLELRNEFVTTQGLRARCLWALGRKAEAVELARAMRNVPANFGTSGYWVSVMLLARSGATAEAEALGTQLLSAVRQGSRSEQSVLSALGRHDQVLQDVERPYYPFIGRELYWSEMWDSMRSDPRFRRVVQQSGRAAYYDTAIATRDRLQKEPGVLK